MYLKGAGHKFARDETTSDIDVDRAIVADLAMAEAVMGFAVATGAVTVVPVYS